jgi:SAM-dependent methyltransferase
MPHQNHEKNRRAWNETVPVHYRHPDYRLEEFRKGWCSLKSIELRTLGDVSGKKLLHLMCQFGMDTLSWARRGAIVTGVDISDKSIELADKLASEVGLDARFVRSDVIDLIGLISDRFDIVFQSHGTLCWLADLDRWAQVVAHYLKPGGTFFIVDDHPVVVLYESDNETYLQKGPSTYAGATDYCDRGYVLKSELVEYQHPLSQIINSLVNAGLVIRELNEYDHDYYAVKADWYEKDGYWYPPGGPPRYPLMFSLRAVRP